MIVRLYSDIKALTLSRRGTVIEGTVGWYEVFHSVTLGRGTFGIVYLDRDRRTNDNIAVKYIEPPIQHREHYMRYIQNELDILNSINHRNIVDLVHYEQIGRCMYVFLELCECDLQKFASENNTFQDLKFDIILGIAEGINCLHHNRIIHRDIKPDNILIKEEHRSQTAKLTDLGLSQYVPEGGSTSFSATPDIGTKQWMAPEVFADTDDHARYSKPADIYSFGLLTWSVIVHRAGEFLNPLSGPRGKCLGQWTHQLLSTGLAVNIPELIGGENNAEVQAMKRNIQRMIHPQASERYKAQEVCDTLRSITTVTNSMLTEAHMPPPTTGLSGAQSGSHVHLSDVGERAGLGSATERHLTQASTNASANALLTTQGGSEKVPQTVAYFPFHGTVPQLQNVVRMKPHAQTLESSTGAEAGSIAHLSDVEEY